MKRKGDGSFVSRVPAMNFPSSGLGSVSRDGLPVVALLLSQCEYLGSRNTIVFAKSWILDEKVAFILHTCFLVLCMDLRDALLDFL